jgi:hypothetical protein
MQAAPNGWNYTAGQGSAANSVLLYVRTCSPNVCRLAPHLETGQAAESHLAWRDSTRSCHGERRAGSLYRPLLRSQARALSSPVERPRDHGLGLLFLSAPIGIALAMGAGSRGAPKWLVCTVGLGSVPLMIIGFLAVGAV